MARHPDQYSMAEGEKRRGRGRPRGSGNGKNTPVQGNKAGAFDPAVIAFMSQLAQEFSIGNQQHSGIQLTPPPPEVPTVDQFMCQRTESFGGSTDPEEAEKWINSIEKIFDVLGCESHQRVTLAVYRLEGEADQWWNLIQNTRTHDEISTLTWEEFK